MICSDEPEEDEDGDAPDLRGAYGFDGVAMMTALAGEPGVNGLRKEPFLYVCVPSPQLPMQMWIECRSELVTHGLSTAQEGEEPGTKRGCC